jgi:selenocysteine-specific elongation factor
MIVGTAGHIDHGKSALVTALTGRAMDRHAEEKRRGITIDLGFAPLALDGGCVAGVVDVPGHEDFVRTMVAGASGVDVALLVVAADEGVMPQTREHLLVLEQLEVPLGIPVVTKADVAEPDWLELVVADVAEWLAKSPVAFEPPVVVSARTGAGLDELRARLSALAPRIRARARDDLFRLPADRAFSIAGAGTVVTGTAWSGRARVGQQVRIVPAGIEARVRSIESHGRAAERSEPGARTALGLAGIERSDVARGDTVVAADAPWAASPALDAELALAADAPRALAPRTRVRVHLGTAQVLARVASVAPIAPGAKGLVRLALESPLVARGGDRFVLRSFSPVVTIGGGRVLDPAPPSRARRPDGALASGDPGARLGALLRRRQGGADRALLPILLGAPPADVDRLVAGDARFRSVGDRVALAAVLDEAGAAALEQLRGFHRAHPTERGASVETLRRSVAGPEWIADAAIAALAAGRKLVVADGFAALPGFSPRAIAGDADVALVLDEVARAGLTPPSVPELETALGRRDVAAILRSAAAAGRVEAVERDRYYARDALDRFVEVLRQLAAAGDITPAALRDATGASRKFVIPLLEWSDRRGLTVRVGETRRLGPAAGPIRA